MVWRGKHHSIQKMKDVRNSILLSLVIFGLPLVITALFTRIECSIGPVVFFYSLLGGSIFGLLWMRTLWKKWNGYVGLLVGIPIWLVGMILLMNFFIWVTWVMSEMDYDLL